MLQLPPDPTVTIHFTGLLVFCFEEDFKHCQIGVHSQSKNHELSIRIVKKQPGPVISSVQTLTLGHDLIRQASHLWLDIEGPAPALHQGAEPFVVGIANEPPDHEQDFRHMIDLEGEHFYDRPLKVKSNDVLKPSLFITKGLFYTSARTAKSFQRVPEADAGGGHTHNHAHGTTSGAMTSHNLGKIGEYVGVNIYLDDKDQAVVLKAGQNGPELLRLKKEEDTTYEITVENGPTPHSHVGNHFAFYYDAFELNAGEQKMVLEPAGAGFQTIDAPPCNPIWLSESHDLEADV